jgi:hypothetical protein
MYKTKIVVIQKIKQMQLNFIGICISHLHKFNLVINDITLYI